MKRNLAFVKKSNIKWTLEEINKIEEYCGDEISKVLYTVENQNKYVFDDGDDIGFMSNWSANYSDNLKNCNIVFYEDVFPEKIKLGAFDTAILFSTKNSKIKITNEMEEHEFIGDDSILNNFRTLAECYAETRLIPLSSVRLYYLVLAMIELYEQLRPNKMSKFAQNMISYDMTLEKTFIDLYGTLQSLSVAKSNEDKSFEYLYDFDFSMVEGKEGK